MLGIYITVYAGLEHAFEADHLLAVNSLVSNRNKINDAVKDGVYWGIGHTLTIFVVGVLMIGFKFSVNEQIFSYLEACVGIMLVFLGIFRLTKSFKKGLHNHTYTHSHSNLKPHSHTYSHSHFYVVTNHNHSHNLKDHKAAFGVGLVHGLAGSGALVVLVLTQMKTATEGLMYILIFGIGSILGMFIASGLFSISFSKSILKSQKLQILLVVISSLLCIFYGSHVVYTNLFLLL
ncbi:sulfite exporter TauE/SafE family protein [Flavobacterium sp. IMCC34518]|uniref:urease accessory protein UreH domain-containing protein n=1 Tax=Flavobacterium sp. IMCC34518 TaxID=3003623 RepID=UPI0022AC4C27|nr:sulfite exporter TauE/SafE family protein [Flavobacterium sp. IMCC34518]